MYIHVLYNIYTTTCAYLVYYAAYTTTCVPVHVCTHVCILYYLCILHYIHVLHTCMYIYMMCTPPHVICNDGMWYINLLYYIPSLITYFRTYMCYGLRCNC